MAYLAFDLSIANLESRSTHYVALKILVADQTLVKNELETHNILSQSKLQHPGKGGIMNVLDSFHHDGPNGSHLCLIFEAMGPSAAQMVENLPPELGGFQGSKSPASHPIMRFPVWMAKSILRQTLLSVNFLHQCSIAHGDLQPGNILFSVKDLNTVEEGSLVQEHMNFPVGEPRPMQIVERGITEPVRRIDGKTDRWAPRYLALSQSLLRYVDLSPEFVVKLSDFGLSFHISDPPANSTTPIGLRSPEAIDEKKFTVHQDIWSFGCLIFEIIAGRPLFVPCGTADNDDDNDDHWLQLYDILGPLPQHLLPWWPRWDMYYKGNGEKIKNYVGKPPKIPYPLDTVLFNSLEEMFDTDKPDEMGAEEATTVKKLLRQILQYDESKRPSTSDLLKHPWFAHAS